MAIATTGNYPKHLDRDIDKIHGEEYANYPVQYSKVARMGKFPKGNHLTEARVSGLGAHRQIGQGQGVDFDIPVEGREKTVYPIKFGLGFQIVEEMIEDAVHPNVLKMARSLARSANHTLELYFWDLFNSGDDVHQSDDGAYVFANSHTTIKSGDTIDNLATAALSETSFQAMYEYFDTLVDEAGYPIFTTLEKLLVPTSERWIAMRLARQKGGITTETADNPPMDGNLLTTNPANGFVGGWEPMVVRYLDAAFGGSDTAWYGLSKDHDFRFLWKKNIQLYTGEDLHTGNKIYISKFRFKPTVFDYKGGYKSTGAG